MAAFHPSKRIRIRSSSSLSTYSSSGSSSSRRSSVPRRQLAAERASRATVGSGEGKQAGQTQSLDANIDYLISTYLGRQLPQGGKAAVVRAAAAFTGRAEPGRTPRWDWWGGREWATGVHGCMDGQSLGWGLSCTASEVGLAGCKAGELQTLLVSPSSPWGPRRHAHVDRSLPLPPTCPLLPPRVAAFPAAVAAC